MYKIHGPLVIEGYLKRTDRSGNKGLAQLVYGVRGRPRIQVERSSLPVFPSLRNSATADGIWPECVARNVR
jgi:hypothetical protein